MLAEPLVHAGPCARQFARAVANSLGTTWLLQTVAVAGNHWFVEFGSRFSLLEAQTANGEGPRKNQPLLECDYGFDDANIGVKVADGFTDDGSEHFGAVGAFHGVAWL